MTTLGTMKERIASELARPDITSTDARIAAAINTAIDVYQKDRFRFSDMLDPSAPPSFNTVALQTVYGSATSAFISESYAIDYLNVMIGSTLEKLPQKTPEEVRLLLQESSSDQGQPECWAYEGNSIIIYPAPNQVYTFYMGVHRKVAAPASDAETGNPWMVDGELLIRSRAKFELALHVTRNEKMQEAMSPIPPPPGYSGSGHASYYAFQQLKGVANRVTGRGRMRPMPF